jgi:hypothetical protein
MTKLLPLQRIERMGRPERFGLQIYLGGTAAGSSASLPAHPSRPTERDHSFEHLSPLTPRPRPPRYFRSAQLTGPPLTRAFINHRQLLSTPRKPIGFTPKSQARSIQ